MSATHKLKRTNPKIDPSGTQKFVYNILKIFESICTKCRLSVKLLKTKYKKRFEKLSVCIF